LTFFQLFVTMSEEQRGLKRRAHENKHHDRWQPQLYRY